MALISASWIRQNKNNLLISSNISTCYTDQKKRSNNKAVEWNARKNSQSLPEIQIRNRKQS